MFKINRLFTLVTIVFFGLTVSLYAQDKKKLEPEDYGQWQRITGTSFSDDGNWFAYNISLVDGDGWLMFKKVGSDSTGEYQFMHGFNPNFSENNRWAAFQIGVSDDEREKLEDQKKKVKYKLGLMDLRSAEVDTFENIQSYEFAETGNHLVMTKYKPEEQKSGGNDLLVHDLSSRQNQLIGNVSEHAFNEQGTLLAVTIDASEKLGNGVQLLNLRNRSVTVLQSDTADFKDLTWSEEENALAFLKSVTDENYEDETHTIYAYRNLPGTMQPRVFSQSQYDAFPNDYRVVDFRDLQWSDDRETVFLGIKEWEQKEKPEKEQDEEGKVKSDSTQNEEEKDLYEGLDSTNVEIWHWRDDQIQPRQEVLSNQLKQDNHLSAWHLDANTFVQLGDSLIEQVQLTGDQKHAVGYVEKPYEPTFEEEWRDIYLIDVESGEKEKILERREFVNTSPGGDYLLYFWDNEWRAYDIDEREEVNLTSELETRFENYHLVNGREQQRPFGSGQWAEDDAWVLLYDEYDVYRATPDGNSITKLTNGATDSIRYRQVRLDYENDFVDENAPLYFYIYGDFTKKRGYARLDRRDRLQTLLYEDRQIRYLNKADDAGKFVYRAESATDSPDFFYVEQSFNNPIALTNTNPQQEEYYWANDELVTFRNERGQKLQGRLLYPANYDPDKQYPMITYIYERRSQDMHSYTVPTRRSPYNFRRFSSEGYFVFQPDITYELRDPGMSAVASVVPAVEKVLESGMVDREKLGLTGHSWGAYQTSFIITQTDLFNSAVAGAPLTNMVSMYNSIYWNAGITDANIFETSQGRFPDPWWMDWDKFIDNSPIFNIKNTETPLLVEFGTDDGAVDFNQGVELYTTMRRMEKPFVMLVYEGENHGLAREENQIDYATRAFQWHDHYLKGEEAPDWIKEGLPYLQRPAMQEEGNNGR
ncbi:S9 family peptidase [Balneolaceae bacterium YR4-1]|uniref:S9 family peptidase n=1 Tax=Halalkalibaculum roseum TaxID=2709311 RepID=A0A6M1SSF7_9BACT|nr:prolyl oligopeptidase family serine peptidase [Halalkalibaculum roseum]NGP75790.1 S9 family peptidase [Halalkalibaculum roseum]